MKELYFTFWIKTLAKIWALSVDITFSQTVFMLTTKTTVKIGSNAYNTPTLLSNVHNGSVLFPIRTSKNRPKEKHQLTSHWFQFHTFLVKIEVKFWVLPENIGMDRVQALQPTRAKAEIASLSLCLSRRLHNSPQLITLGDWTLESGSSNFGSGSLTIGSEAGPDT